MLPFGNEFFKTRKLFQDSLPRSGVFEELQTHQAHIFLKNLVVSPDDWRAHIVRCVRFEIFTESLLMK